jgi:hypothetical protein
VHTGQSGAPFRPLARPRVSRRSRGRPFAWPTVGSPDSPVPPSDRWLGHVSRADRAADRLPGRQLAHRTVRCTPDSPVNYSRTPSANSREQRLQAEAAWRTGQSGAPDRNSLLAAHSQLFFFLLLSVSNT